MQPVPTDLILHALAENLIGMEGSDESLHSLGHTIIRTCIDLRALPAQWCNGAGVGQQMSWLTRRLADGDIHPHVAAETRSMEVAISRRLADTALSLLVTQDEGDKTAALTLLEAAHRVVGLPGAEVHDEDIASWESRILALEGQLKAAIDLKDAWGRDCNKYLTLYEEWRTWASEVANTKGSTDPGLQALIKHTHSRASTLVAQHEEMYAALRKEADEAIAEAAAHFEDVKKARDEADALRAKLQQEEAKVLDLEADVERLAESDKRADLYRDHMQEVRAALNILTNASHSDTIKRISDIRNEALELRGWLVNASGLPAIEPKPRVFPGAGHWGKLARAAGLPELAEAARTAGSGDDSPEADARYRITSVLERLARTEPKPGAEALHPRRQYVADLKAVKEAASQSAEEYRQRILAINEALGIACNASQELTLKTIGELRQKSYNGHSVWETWACNLLGVDDGTALELQGLIAKKVKRAEAISQQNLTRHDIIAAIVAALKVRHHRDDQEPAGRSRDTGRARHE